MNKLLGGAIVVILLILAVEGGYYAALAQARTERSAVARVTPAPATQPTPPLLPSLFDRKTIRIFPLIPESGIWQSEWTIGAAGTLVSLAKEFVSIYIEADGALKSFSFPPDQPVVYSQWSQRSDKSSPVDPETIHIGDNVSVSFTIETTSGKMKNFAVTKNIE